jgi:hypothetical protein
MTAAASAAPAERECYSSKDPNYTRQNGQGLSHRGYAEGTASLERGGFDQNTVGQWSAGNWSQAESRSFEGRLTPKPGKPRFGASPIGHRLWSNKNKKRGKDHETISDRGRRLNIKLDPSIERIAELQNEI